MAEFDTGYRLTLAHEGRYVNDPTDRGGETWKGIARKFWGKWEGWVIIDQAKEQENFPTILNELNTLDNFVKQFYKKEFWNKLSLDQIKDQDIANEMFDTAVNQGTKTAAKYLQEALNLLNRNERDYQDIAVDGAVGPVTLGIANNHKRPYNILKTLNGLQFMRYYNIAKKNPSQEKFFNGWLNRI